ncbi:hypothetical protein GCM10007276_00930 [Agaricicola taiwanensis]|uniref:Uncharacterized protein n=1 Tax=Agaricicola taiwanensis TaxID=591372 RepID=A0A8J2VES4_9RHOB|nr:hypothetical protein [Agaricicola taiwanensis]GGE27572.1 hypothetical protein GCM10007276_00930 [Agaricicola taiwanensis]
MNGDLVRFTELVDRYGPDIGCWPDAIEANWARRTLMAAPEARAVHEEALRLSDALAGYGAALDVMVKPDVSSRVAAAVMVKLPRRVSEFGWWMPRIAAGFMLAVIAGGMFDFYVQQGAQAQDSIELASLDTLVYGPGELELP